MVSDSSSQDLYFGTADCKQKKELENQEKGWRWAGHEIQKS